MFLFIFYNIVAVKHTSDHLQVMTVSGILISFFLLIFIYYFYAFFM